MSELVQRPEAGLTPLAEADHARRRADATVDLARRARVADEELVPLMRERGDAWREWGRQLGAAEIGGQRAGHVTGGHVADADRKAVERARKLAAVDDDDYQQWRDSATPEGLTLAALLRSPTTAQNLVASDENEWYTPTRYIEAVHQVLGRIDLDPASCEAANRTIKAKTIYTTADDGLEQSWSGRVFLNPPYGRLAGGFAARLADEYAAGNVVAAIVLVNAHCTDTSWFQRMWDGTLCFTDHRIDFDSADRSKTSSSTHGSVFVYFGPKAASFAAVFSEFGQLAQRWSA